MGKWQRFWRGLLTWGIEVGIGLIPLIAHSASIILSAQAAAANSAPAAQTDRPELCVLAVVLPSLSIFSVFRRWVEGDPDRLTWFTVMLLIANGCALLSAAFTYPYAADNRLASGTAEVPSYLLAAALVASLLLAAERSLTSER